MPPVWMSIVSPRYFIAIAEHSICHPGIAASPRTVPLHQMVGLAEHPQREIVRAVLVGRMLEALRSVLLVETLAREAAEPILAAILLDVEVHAALRDVRNAGVDDSFRERDHIADMIGRARPYVRRLEIQRRAIALELLEIIVRDFEWRFALRACGFLDLVLAGVLVARHVPDVRHVHHVAHFVAVELERPAQAVDEHVRAQIPEMLRQIDRRSARIKRNFGRILRLEFLDRAAQRIENVEWFHECERQA